MIYIRADGNSIIGMGHLTRCMSIANKLSQMTEVCFLTADEMSLKEITSNGFKGRLLSAPAFSLDEAYSIQRLLLEDTKKASLILVDSYKVSNEYFERLREIIPVAYMDDLIKTVYKVDMLINYNTYAERNAYDCLYKDEKDVPLLVLGGDYVPLRDQFSEYKKEYINEVTDILITTGGGDNDNLAGEIAKKLLCSLKDKNIKIHIVCGAFNPNYDKLLELSETNKNVFIHRSVKNMAELMKACDFAVSAGGSTCYELCSVGIPFVTFAYVDNQLGIISDMENKGAAKSAGFIADKNSKDAVIEKISLLVEKLISDKEKRLLMSQTASKLVDGLGAKRIAEKLYFFKEG